MSRDIFSIFMSLEIPLLKNPCKHVWFFQPNTKRGEAVIIFCYTILPIPATSQESSDGRRSITYGLIHLVRTQTFPKK